jgi:4-hydroxy-3-polyprenylbenzoate decarboxylase
MARTPDPNEAPVEIPNTQSERAVTSPWALAITGASGAPYAVRLLEVLASRHIPLWLIISPHGWRLLSTEVGISTPEELITATGGDWSTIEIHDDTDRGAVPASGSASCSGMVICPCSMGTVAAVAHGASRSLVERAADVTLKERRPLLLVPRETPLSLVHLRNLVAVTEAGATVIPAAPGFYHRPGEVSQLVDFIVQRVLDHMKLDIQLVSPWEGGE